jgi:epoxide hydrolase A/B
VTERAEDYSLLRHADDVKALMGGLGAREVVLVGHDWGCWFPRYFVMRFPRSVAAAVS